MTGPTEFKAGLPETFSGKNDNATCWLLAMKAYFTMNDEIYKDKKTTVLVFLNRMSQGRGGTFAEDWYLKLANPAIPESERLLKNYAPPLKIPSSQRIPKTEPTKLSTPSTWTCLIGISMSMSPPSSWLKHTVESTLTASLWTPSN